LRRCPPRVVAIEQLSCPTSQWAFRGGSRSRRDRQLSVIVVDTREGAPRAELGARRSIEHSLASPQGVHAPMQGLGVDRGHGPCHGARK
jgi:hypothetical protein